MKKQIYGNKLILDSVESMLKSGRLSHGFLLYGERGLGKKTIAGRIASMLAASSEHSADKIDASSYPDIIWAEHSGVRQGFSAETVRRICQDAFLAPNNGERKVYIFDDCDNISPAAQNALLKLIEEPPDFTYFIFTARTKDVLLPTVLSRIISFGVTECSEKDTMKALLWDGFSEDEAEEAASKFSGNIGKCIEYLHGGELKQAADLADEILEASVLMQEYRLLKALYQLEGSRTLAEEALRLAGLSLRDCLFSRLESGGALGCCHELSADLASKISINKAQKLYALIRDTAEELGTNVQVSLALSAFCGRAMDLS